MSQQINLLLPELRPRFDWLALPVVAGLAAVGIVLLILVVQYQSFRESRLKSQAAAIEGQFLNLQQQAQLLGQTVAARKADAALPLAIAVARAGVAQRREVFDYVARGTGAGAGSYSGQFGGFANLAGDGVWLIGFSLAPDALEIRGRLLDPSILSRYINRLNDEAAFAGRRFAALEMSGVEPATLPAVHGSPAAPARYTEFVLRSEPPATGGTP